MDLDRVAAHAFLRDLPQDDLEAVARAASPREFAAGERLTSQGDFGHCLFLVEAGTAEVSIDGERVRSVGPGDAIGEIAVLASGRRTASVVATSPVQAIALFKRDVWALDREAPAAAQRLRAALDEHRRPREDAVPTHDA